MKKIKVLILPSDQFGVGHYRSIWPAQEIQKSHSDEFEVDIRLQQPVVDTDIGKFDIVHFHRRINEPDKTIEWIKRFREGGAIVICDLDDYWIPFRGHPAREMVMKHKTHLQIMDACRAADIVTTTTTIFEKHIQKDLNKNIDI